MLNDGTAMVCYELFLQLIENPSKPGSKLFVLNFMIKKSLVFYNLLIIIFPVSVLDKFLFL